ALLRITGKTDVERRVVINTIGPVWEGNQVWLILGGGAIFAAWPMLYAISFSGFYLAMFAVLVCLIIRPVAFKFRSKQASTAWRNTWDWLLTLSGWGAALVFGVAMGNVLLGVPFRLSDDMRIFWDGSFFDLFTPFALLCGLVSLTMLLMHGAAWLVFKTEGAVQARATRWGVMAAVLTTVLYVVAGLWLAKLSGFVLTEAMSTTGPSNPMLKSAAVGEGAWLANYAKQPLLWIVPAIGVCMPLLAALGMKLRREWLGLMSSGLAIAGIVLSVGVSMFPFILPSTVNPQFSLMVWDASSSHLTLFIMLVCAVIFMPIILAYTSWVFHIMRGKVQEKEIEGGKTHAY
ncbi:cytochrome d ubiquinol oxidase subunit II, partial [Comamonas kerstersii]